MLIPTILSGGSGTRLWPVSREAHPKPFMKLPDGKTLLQKTILRAAHLSDVAEVLTVTNREYYFKTKDDYAQISAEKHLPKISYLLEPFGRNTAPAIALAALAMQAKHGDDAVMLVLPADHLIDDESAFTRAVKEAYRLAKENYLVTFGIKPTAPETGFGYIEYNEPCDSHGNYYVNQFVEKPSLEVAHHYLAAGNYLWNAGIFCFKVSTLLKQFENHAEKLLQSILTCWKSIHTKQYSENSTVMEIPSATFEHITDISLDYALMEKADNVVVVPCKFEWSDLGSWLSVSQLAAPDHQGNRVIGEAMLVDVKNTYIQSEERLVAAIGIENLVIVDTPDALLVANRDATQKVKKIVEQLKIAEHQAYKLHRTVNRPWGTYTVLEEGNAFKIKRIVVNPGASLSLQMHHHRSEHWIVVSGVAQVTKDQETFLVQTNESTYIPAGHQHRLENPGQVELVLIEVQTGDYLGEDDIVRIEDKYGRTNSSL